jgi:hypothetical protein
VAAQPVARAFDPDDDGMVQQPVQQGRDTAMEGMLHPEKRRRLRGRHGDNQMARLDARQADIEFPATRHSSHGSDLPVRLDIKASSHGAWQARHTGHADKAGNDPSIIPTGASGPKIVQSLGKA